jgi:penicillin-insensitive murein endopeptidase
MRPSVLVALVASLACAAPAGAASQAIGLPNHGRLVGGVQLPESGPGWFTWNWQTAMSPNAPERRWSTDKLVALIKRVTRQYAAAHPGAAPIGVADMSFEHGGKIGAYGMALGHASHQNGLDVDVLLPRADGCLCRAESPDQVDYVLAQDLANRFVRAGAQYVFTGVIVPLAGPRGVVIPLYGHDDHMHVRIFPPPPPRRTTATRSSRRS